MTEGYTELKCFTLAPTLQNVRFTIVNTETNEESPIQVAPGYLFTDGEGVKLRCKVDLTNEQTLISNPKIQMYKPEYEITKSIINNVRIPVEHLRPPKPTKKWSRRYH